MGSRLISDSLGEGFSHVKRYTSCSAAFSLHHTPNETLGYPILRQDGYKISVFREVAFFSVAVLCLLLLLLLLYAGPSRNSGLDLRVPVTERDLDDSAAADLTKRATATYDRARERSQAALPDGHVSRRRRGSQPWAVSGV